MKYQGRDPFIEASLALFLFILALVVYTEVSPNVEDRMLDVELEEWEPPKTTTIYDERIVTPPDNILGVF